MTLNPYIVLGSAVVGLLVGLTGAGGGALMTPMLILLFGVKPSAAISSDLVAAVLMRPVGAAVHLRKGTVNLRLVGWMVVGSVPMAFVGAYLLHRLGGSSAQQKHVEVALGAALLVGAAAMVFRYILDRRSGNQRIGTVHKISVRPVPTIVIGMIGGVIVGLTSVGSGSLMIVLLLFLYPMLSAGQLVGTDLTQAVPLTAAAALGALIFGHGPVRGDRLARGRQRARRADRLLPVVAGARPLHPAHHHVRDLRLGPEVRGGRHDRAGLDPLPGGPGRRGLLAGPGPAVGERPAGRRRGRRPAFLHHGRWPGRCRSQRAQTGSGRQPAGRASGRRSWPGARLASGHQRFATIPLTR